MKKKLFLGLALSALMTTMVPVFAAGDELNKDVREGETIVSYEVAQGFTITIPADLELTTEANTTAQLLEAKDVRLTTNETLTVTMKSDEYDATDKYRVRFDNSFIKYEVKSGTAEDAVNTAITENEKVLLTLASGTTGDKLYLKFFTDEEKIKEATQSGVHTDTLTFTCEIN